MTYILVYTHSVSHLCVVDLSCWGESGDGGLVLVGLCYEEGGATLVVFDRPVGSLVQ